MHRSIMVCCRGPPLNGENRPEPDLLAGMHRGLLWGTYWANENTHRGADFGAAHRR